MCGCAAAPCGRSGPVHKLVKSSQATHDAICFIFRSGPGCAGAKKSNAGTCEPCAAGGGGDLHDITAVNGTAGQCPQTQPLPSAPQTCRTRSFSRQPPRLWRAAWARGVRPSSTQKWPRGRSETCADLRFVRPLPGHPAPASTAVLCAKKVKGAGCTDPATDGKFCTSHACPHAGCTKVRVVLSAPLLRERQPGIMRWQSQRKGS